MHHNRKNDIYSHAETSGARQGAFFRFSRPTLRRFLHLFVSNQFWRTAGAFSKTTIFFKLQVGVSLVPSAPPLCLHRTTPRPRPTPAAPKFDRLKSLYLVVPVDGGWGRSNKIVILQSPVQLVSGFFWDISLRPRDLSQNRWQISRYLPL